MSIDTDSKKKEPLLTSQKLDALRDMLSNHKTVKIKPVNVEMRQHLATMRMNYEKSLKDKLQPAKQVVETKAEVKPQVKQVQPQPFVVPKVEPKQEAKPEPFKPSPISVPSFTPVGGVKPTLPGLTNVARTLFTDEPKQEPAKPQAQVPQLKPMAPAFSFSSTPASADTRSVLKDLLQNKQSKSDLNTFMGQNICSPSSFAFTTTAATSTPAPSAVFTAKPIADINNMFSKFQPQTFVQDSKPQAFAPEPKTQAFSTEPKLPAFAPDPKPFESKLPTSIFGSPKSSETGEPEADSKTAAIKPKTDKPLTNLFAMKTSTPIPSPIVPDVLKTTKDVKTDSAPKPVEKEISKENVPQKVEPKVIQKPVSDNKEGPKPLATHTGNKTSIFGSAPQPVPANSSTPGEPQKPVETDAKEEPFKAPEKSESTMSSVSSIFGSTVATAGPDSTSQSSTPTSEQPTLKPDSSTPDLEPSSSQPSQFLNIITTSPFAASVFGAAAAPQPKPASPSASIFATGASPPPTPSSVFGTSSQVSIFGSTSPTATTTAVFGSVFGSTAQSVFSSAANAAKPTVFSTPTPSTPETPPSPQSVFGSTVTPATQAGSIFGSSFAQPSLFAATTTVAPSSPSSVFGSSTTSSVFGSTLTTQASVFGASTTTTQSVFGTATATTQSSIFGSAASNAPSAFTSTTTPSSGASSIFAAASTTKPSVFGGSGTSVFGSASPNAQTSVFGTPSTQASVFGSSTATTQSSVFGTPTPASQSSVFGAAPTTQASVFGAQPTTTAQSSIFGGGETNMFAAASISTTSAPSPTSGGSIFGGGSPSSVFGSANTNVFGSKTAFGQTNSSAAAIFGGGGATAFGQQKPASNFWSGGNTNTEGGFGATGFGQQPTTQASSIFGNTSGGSFSTPSPVGQAFGSVQAPAFGAGDNKPSAFGSPQQQAAPAFGGSPGFGSKPVFGQPTGFGSPPSGGGFGSAFGGGFNKSPGGGFGAPAAFGGGATFGGGAAFGGGSSPGKMFGGAQPTGFGQPTQSNATFESLATQNTLTFGNLAQQAQAPQPQAPTFNTSPSFTGWRG